MVFAVEDGDDVMTLPELMFDDPLNRLMFGWGLAIIVIAISFVILLRNLAFHSPELRLRRKGLDSLLTGHPEVAEMYFRKALVMRDPADRVRPLVCLGDALMDQGRYLEAKDFLERALQLGDLTGSGQDSMADLLLLTRTHPEKAIEMASEAVHLSTTKPEQDLYFGGGVYNDLKRAKYWARTAQALAQLDRHAEAQQAIDRALRIAEGAKVNAKRTRPRTSLAAKLVLGDRRLRNHRYLVMAATHWQIGLAFLAIDDKSRAADHFRITHDADHRGKYRRLAQQRLDRIESPVS